MVKGEQMTVEQIADPLCHEIMAARQDGAIHCGILSGAATVDDVAIAFGLRPNSAVNYREIDRSLALDIATRVLHRDLAYSSVIGPLDRSCDLARRFLESFVEPALCFTNASFRPDDRYPRGITLSGWSPATDSTFDTGIIVLGKDRAGCLWVEDED